MSFYQGKEKKCILNVSCLKWTSCFAFSFSSSFCVPLLRKRRRSKRRKSVLEGTKYHCASSTHWQVCAVYRDDLDTWEIQNFSLANPSNALRALLSLQKCCEKKRSSYIFLLSLPIQALTIMQLFGKVMNFPCDKDIYRWQSFSS